MLKTPPSREKTKPKTPTTKNGKFVITFKVLGTPENTQKQKSSKSPKNQSKREICKREVKPTNKITHVKEMVMVGRTWDLRSNKKEDNTTKNHSTPYTTSLQLSQLLICHPTHLFRAYSSNQHKTASTMLRRKKVCL